MSTTGTEDEPEAFHGTPPFMVSNGKVEVKEVPSFTDAVLGSKLRSYANNFLASTYQARGEAIKRNSVVKLCASSNGTSCMGSWEQGWIVLAGTTVIQRQPALSSGMKMTESADVGSIDFPATGVGVTVAVLLAALGSVGVEAVTVAVLV